MQTVLRYRAPGSTGNHLYQDEHESCMVALTLHEQHSAAFRILQLQQQAPGG